MLGPALFLSCLVYGQVSTGQISTPASAPPQGPAAEAGKAAVSGPSLYVKLQLDAPVKISALKTGDVVEGKLTQDVFSGDRQVFPAGSRIRLTVDQLEKRRRVPNDHWPWIIKVFTPRRENYPTFKTAIVSLPNGSDVPLQVSLIAIGQKTEVRAPAKADKSTPPGEKSGAQVPAAPQTASGKKPGPIVTLQAEASAATEFAAAPASAPAASGLASLPAEVTLAAGTQAKIILLGSVSAGKSQAGDSFQARLVQPVYVNSTVVLPEGSVFSGKVVKSTRPRWLSRSGSLLLTFTGLTLPGGTSAPLVASVSAAEVDERSHTKIDAEGKLRGDRPGKAWALINIGMTVGLAKVADDATQLLIEAVGSAATDASTAGTGRIVAICVSAVYLVTRHGRDVVLPTFTEMNIMFDRPVSLSAAPPAAGVK